MGMGSFFQVITLKIISIFVFRSHLTFKWFIKTAVWFMFESLFFLIFFIVQCEFEMKNVNKYNHVKSNLTN